MGARDLSRAVAVRRALHGLLACVLLGTLPAAAQRVDDPNLERHLRNAYVERRAAFERAWLAADDAARARVREDFAERRRGGVPAVHHVSAADLATLTRELEGAARADAEAWGQRVADALDLRVQPGAFEPARGERGEPMIVRVLPLRAPGQGGADEVDLSLYWVGPDGREVRARTEPVHRDAFVLPGFEMYVFAPATDPGDWRLVPEVALGEERWRGRAVPVACVRDLFARFDRAVADGAPGAWKDALRRGVEHGVRDATWGPLSELLERGAAAPAPPQRSAVAGVAAASVALAPAGEARGIVVVVVPRAEDPEWSLVGPRGAAWRALPAAGQHLVLTAAPIVAARGASALELCAALRALQPGLPLTLVVSGGDVGRLPIALAAAGGEPPIDRLVLHTLVSGDRAPRAPLPGVPTLYAVPLDEDLARAEVEGAPGVSWWRRADPPAIVELALPGELARWLAELPE
jgi:hypothetical protein